MDHITLPFCLLTAGRVPQTRAIGTPFLHALSVRRSAFGREHPAHLEHYCLCDLAACHGPLSTSQLSDDRPCQFTATEYHFALLAGHGGVQIARITERAERAVERADVVLDLRQPVTNALASWNSSARFWRRPLIVCSYVSVLCLICSSSASSRSTNLSGCVSASPRARWQSAPLSRRR